MLPPKRTTHFTPIEIGILVLGLTTAFVHLILLNLFIGTIDPIYTLNGIGYLILIASYFTPQLAARKNYIRWLTIAYSLINIIGWFFLESEGGFLGLFTKMVEIGLIILLLLDGKKQVSKTG